MPSELIKYSTNTKKKIEEKVRIAGFIAGGSCIDHISNLQELIEK